MKAAKMLTYLLLAMAIGAVAFVRLAPSDPARWHIDPGTGPITRCTDLVKTRSSARVTCLHARDPAALLAALDALALASPRTTRLAGSAAEGRITWISRSRLWAFPDYTTAQTTVTADGTRLDLFARARFGQYDWGVNAGRLAAWLQDL